MKKFLAIYLGTFEALQQWKAQEPEVLRKRQQAGMEGWKEWSTKHAASIVDHGAPLGKTKRIDGEGMYDTRNELGAYTIVQAESHDAAALLFVDHPHFTLFPGECVELMECLELPES